MVPPPSVLRGCKNGTATRQYAACPLVAKSHLYKFTVTRPQVGSTFAELGRGLMDTQAERREPMLWWIAGADSRILTECPRADQIFVQHLGISLIGAFVFVFLISAI